MPKPKDVRTDITCPHCGENLVFATSTLQQDDAAPLVSPTCFKAYWPSELSREARQGEKPAQADLKGDKALWSEVRKGRPEKPGKPEDVRQYALERITERIR